MRNEILTWINTALKELSVDITRVPESKANQIVAKAKEAFVEGNPSAWWMGLKNQPEIFSAQYFKLEEILPSYDPKYWFIPETETHNLPVFDGTIQQIEAVLGGCPFFEYYIVNKDNGWLIAESHHDEFYVVLRQSI